MSPNGEFRKYMAAIGDATMGGDRAWRHFDEDDWIAFHHDTMPPATRQAAALHLTECNVCTAKLDDVRDFFEARYVNEPEWSESERQRAWRDLRSRLPFERQAAPAAMPVRARFPLNSRAIYALAACLLLTTALSGAIAIRLYRQTRDLQGLLDQNQGRMAVHIGSHNRSADSLPSLPDASPPQINTTIREITVYDTVRSTQNGKEVLVTTLASNARYFAFTLDLVNDSHPTYRIEFTDLQGKSLLRQQNLKPNERSNEQASEARPGQRATLSVSIPRQTLKPGQYLFQIYGEKGSDAILLEALQWSFN
jgi:hypothetical protein